MTYYMNVTADPYKQGRGISRVRCMSKSMTKGVPQKGMLALHTAMHTGDFYMGKFGCELLGVQIGGGSLKLLSSSVVAFGGFFMYKMRSLRSLLSQLSAQERS